MRTPSKTSRGPGWPSAMGLIALGGVPIIGGVVPSPSPSGSSGGGHRPGRARDRWQRPEG